jgi:DNA-binding MarR family transcriptional regulator
VEDPDWLDPEEHEAWLGLVGLMARLEPRLDAQLRRDAGLSLFEYNVMAGLSESTDHTLRMRDLAAMAEGSLSRLSQVVGRLERRGWVERRPDPEDGRTTLATLTEKGYAVVVAHAPAHVEEVRRQVFDRLTRAQVRQLAAITQRIVGRVVEPGR